MTTLDLMRSLAAHPGNAWRLGLVALVGVLALAAGAMTSAQEAPLVPFVPKIISAFTVNTVPAEYEVVLEVVDFAPGAGTPEYAYLGRAFVTVLEGELTYQSGDQGTVYPAGEERGFSLPPVIWLSLRNDGGVPARALITVLLLPDSPLMVADLDSPAPANGPVIVHAGRRLTTTQPGNFVLAQGIFEAPVSGGSTMHCHLGGGGMSINLSGETVHVLGDTTVTQGPGQVFEDLPNRPVQHLNRSSAPAMIATSYLIPVRPPFAVDATPAGDCPAA